MCQFLWTDARGRFHIVSHNQGKGNVCQDPQDHGCGAHLFSEDSYTWHIGKSPVYSSDVLLVNGTKARFGTRQRPQLVFESTSEGNGSVGAPLYLFNGASFEGNNPDLQMLTHTYAFSFASGAQQ